MKVKTDVKGGGGLLGFIFVDVDVNIGLFGGWGCRQPSKGKC